MLWRLPALRWSRRKALWAQLQFALDGEPDPWFEMQKAAVDTRQFDAISV